MVWAATDMTQGLHDWRLLGPSIREAAAMAHCGEAAIMPGREPPLAGRHVGWWVGFEGAGAARRGGRREWVRLLDRGLAWLHARRAPRPVALGGPHRPS